MELVSEVRLVGMIISSGRLLPDKPTALCKLSNSKTAAILNGMESGGKVDGAMRALSPLST